MALEAFEKIKKTEADAAVIKEVADEQAKGLVAEARQKAKLLREESDRAAEDEARALYAKADAECRDITLNATRNAKVKSALLKSEAQTKVDAAVKYIVEGVLLSGR